jgi:hypothetical protein
MCYCLYGSDLPGMINTCGCISFMFLTATSVLQKLDSGINGNSTMHFSLPTIYLYIKSIYSMPNLLGSLQLEYFYSNNSCFLKRTNFNLLCTDKIWQGGWILWVTQTWNIFCMSYFVNSMEGVKSWLNFPSVYNHNIALISNDTTGLIIYKVLGW